MVVESRQTQTHQTESILDAQRKRPRISVTLAREIRDALVRAEQFTGRYQSAIVEMALRLYLEEQGFLLVESRRAGETSAGGIIDVSDKKTKAKRSARAKRDQTRAKQRRKPR